MTGKDIALHSPKDNYAFPLQPASRPLGADWEELRSPAERKPNAIGVHGSGRRVSFNSPVILRSDGLERANHGQLFDQASWNRIGAAVRKIGGGLLGPIDIFQNLPVKDIPIRICPLSSHRMPTIDEIISSDMIELQLYKGDESFLSAADNSHAGEQPTSHSPTGYGQATILIELLWNGQSIPQTPTN